METQEITDNNGNKYITVNTVTKYIFKSFRNGHPKYTEKWMLLVLRTRH